MALQISCEECSMQGTHVCDDCVVTFICALPEGVGHGGALIIDADEERAVRMLGRAGLVPVLRHQRRADCA